MCYFCKKGVASRSCFHRERQTASANGYKKLPGSNHYRAVFSVFAVRFFGSYQLPVVSTFGSVYQVSITRSSTFCFIARFASYCCEM